MDVIDILKEYLKSKGYDGLYNEECGCTIKELAPCSENCGDCSPGYIHPGGDGFDFHIRPEKFNDDQWAFELFAKQHPRDTHESDPDRFWAYFQAVNPGVSREAMVELLADD